MTKNIVIFPHLVFNNADGGTTVQYYLASVLDNLGINVMICNIFDNNKINNIFNKFICKEDIDIENTIVIYCEGIIGNPLKAKYIVRWMLSKLGQNVPKEHYFTWNQNELLYFFNSEIELIDSGIYFKQLSLFYLNKEIQNWNMTREGVCYTKRKSYIHQTVKNLHPDDSFEITRAHSQQDYITIFNNHHMFISYDPLTFLIIISPMCGCICVVHPIEGVSKKDWLKMTAVNDYLIDNNVDLYGIAYGMEQSEILFAENTIHLAKKQMEELQQWFIDKYVTNFIKDIDNFDDNNNKLSKYSSYFFNISDITDFDATFYRENNSDLKHMSIYELVNHYKLYGKGEERFVSEKQFQEFVENTGFDTIFYRENNSDLKYMSIYDLARHYKLYGKGEERFVSEKQFQEFVENTGFDTTFYRENNSDLKHMSIYDLARHYKLYGKGEGRLISEKQKIELEKS